MHTEICESFFKDSTYFSTKVEITKQDGCFWARDQKNDVDNKQESKHVIDLMRPEKNEGKKLIKIFQCYLSLKQFLNYN